MYQFFSYLIFYFSATNQHGVHSPFVYDYVTKCLYKRTNLRLPVGLKVLVKSLDYFGCSTLWVMHSETETKDKIKAACPTISFSQSKPEVMYAKMNDVQPTLFDEIEVQNHTVLLIDHIHKRKRNLEKWETIKRMQHVSVTIDLFYCGLVFFRKEQAKEHFKIRI